MLTNRWYDLRYHKEQSECFYCKKRFVINHSGRRSGKTELLGKRKIIRLAMKGSTKYPDWRCFVGAPVRHQAKKIYWNDLKALTPKYLMNGKPQESDLIIRLINGSEIHVGGLENPQRIEGVPWNHFLLDEFGNMREETWPEHVRPSLSDRKGSCDFIGVPEGRNHFYNLVKKAENNPLWKVFHWHSNEVLDHEEIEQAKQDLDELVFQQEYGGEFVAFSGAVYYNFDPKIHVGKYRKFYDKKKPLIFCFDFNVSPGVAVVVQEMGSDVFKISSNKTITCVIGEVYIPKYSNTEKVAKKLLEDWKDHEGAVFCYGDSTGGSDGSAKLQGSDWVILKKSLIGRYRENLHFNVPKKNPLERQRINAVNSRLKSISGEVKMVFDGEYAKHTILDFEGTRILKGSAGEIDKKSDPKLTHLSDGLGYYISKDFPVSKYIDIVEMRELLSI